MIKIKIANYNNCNENFWRKNFIKNNFFLNDKCIKYHKIDKHLVEKFKSKWKIKEKNKFSHENSILNFLNGLNINYQNRTKEIIPPQELDIYIPKYNLAIEYDGLIFHSSGKNLWNKTLFDNFQEKYHLNKTKKCLEKNIQLLHIFENEWVNYRKKLIWKSIIKSKLKLNKTIYARKCSIKVINDFNFVNQFLECNHLQGKYCDSFKKSSINIGLYYNNKIMCLMSFIKLEGNNKFDYELVKFCNRININVLGGASRLLNYFIKNYNSKSIITFADRRFSSDNLYNNLKFKKMNENQINCYWFKDTRKLYNSTYSLKSKILKRKEKYNNKLSREKNMYENGYRKIYDCGTITYGLFTKEY